MRRGDRVIVTGTWRKDEGALGAITAVKSPEVMMVKIEGYPAREILAADLSVICSRSDLELREQLIAQCVALLHDATVVNKRSDDFLQGVWAVKNLIHWT